jgi:phosphatidylglycerol:prolipoprotein diacylglycerol transferase
VNLTHLAFEVLAWISALAGTYLVYRWRLDSIVQQVAAKVGAGYFLALSAGGIVGAFAFGTFNLLLSNQQGIGRSILGALVGAIAAIEIYKRHRRIKGSTGAVFAAPFCLAIIIGRIGCYAAGLDDFTYGTPTTLPWAIDFGDGVKRHPVQLYESIAMSLCLLAVILGLGRRQPFMLFNAFYFTMVWYGVQRFFWEFLKPYGKLIGPFNLFHGVCLLLIIYAVFMPRYNRSFTT